MKKLIFLILIELVFINSAFSSPVDTTTAKAVAKNFYLKISTSESRVKKSASLRLANKKITAIKSSENYTDSYYVYNFGDNNGFVIVAGDNNVTPILGYSDTGSYSVDNHSPDFVSWMKGYENQIQQVRKYNIKADSIIQGKWNSLINLPDNIKNVLAGVSPLIQTKWGQGIGYNTYCPYNPTCNKNVVTGCVATAMAQIMKYWGDKIGHPTNGVSNHFYTCPYYGFLSVNFGTTSYNWANMPYNSGNDEVAKLMYHCGVSVSMDYGIAGTCYGFEFGGSGAYTISNDPTNINAPYCAQFSYKMFFGFDGSKIQGLDKEAEGLSDAQWITILKNELNNGRPVQYVGKSNTGGHTWVCDGYDILNNFHMNWGWDGADNGYFTLSNLNSYAPISYDTGAYIGDYGDYSNQQKAIIGIIPDAADLIPINQSLSATSIQAGSNITAYCAEKNSGSVAAGANVISIHLSSDAFLTPDKNGDRYVDEISTSGVAAYSTSNTYSKSIKIPSDVPAGTYYVYFSVDGREVIDEIFEDNNFASAMLTVTAATTTLNPPRNLTATAGDGQATLNWSAPVSGTPTSYKVYMSTSQNGTYTSTSTTSTTKTYTGLTNNTTYWFYVEAVYSSGFSATSKVSATPAAVTTSYPPRNLTATSGNGQVSLSWSSPSSGTPANYNIYKSTSQTGTYSFYSSSNTTSATVTGLTNGTTYWFYVKAVYLTDISGSSNVVSATPIFVTGDDFYVQNEEVSSTTVEAGNTIDVSASQCYTGSKLDANMGNVNLGYYLSTNTSFSSSADTFLDYSPSALGSDDPCNDESETLTIPAGTAPGTYYLLFVADYEDSYSETDENNNVRYIKITVSAGVSSDDFYVENATVSSSTIEVGASFTVSCNQCYSGNALDINLASVRLGYYLSTNNSFNIDEDIYLGAETSGLGSDDQCNAESATFYLSDTTKIGSYYILFVADYDKSFTETNENNNCTSIPIQIVNCTNCTYTIPPSGINFQSAGGSGNFTITTSDNCCDWTATTSDNFITIVNPTGRGTKAVNYIITPSNAGGSRTGTIKVAGQTHTITQNCVEACSNSQSFEWAVKAGSSTLSDAAADLAIDATGNLYMTGDIQGAANFGGGYTLTTPSTAPDVFVSKHNSLGQIQWAIKYGDTDQEYGTGIAIDNSGNIYVIGNSANAVTFGSTTLTANGTNEEISFILKLNSSGILQWAKKLNNLYSGNASDIKIDNNYIFVTGMLSDYTTGVGSGLFIAKYNTSGTQIWYKTYGFSNNILQPMGIAVDYTGNILISGVFETSFSFGSTNLITDYSFVDIEGFIAKLDANGNPIWAKQLSSPGRSSNALESIAIDETNNIYTIGYVDSTAIVGNITIPLSANDKNIIIKYDQNGNPLWVKNSTEGQQNNHRIIKGNDGNLYFAGRFYGSIKIDNFKIVGIGSSDNYIGCMDTNGKVKWLKGFGGIKSESIGGIVVNSTNEIFVSGGFSESVVFSNTTLTSSGSTDIFLAKFKQCDPPKSSISYSGTLSISGNETKSLTTDYCSSYTYQWLRNNINIEGATLPSYNASLGGSYNVLVKSYDGCETMSNAVVLTGNTINPSIYSDNYNISIYPNPTTGKFEISEIESMGNECKVEIINNLGSLIYISVYKNFGNKISLDLSPYTEGLYLIRLSNNEVSYQKKVIKK